MDLIFKHRRLTILFAIQFCYLLNLTSLLILPKWFTQLHFDDATLGLLVGASGISSLGFTLLAAPHLDRYPRMRFVRIGMVVSALSTLALPFVVHSTPLLWAARLASGFSIATAIPSVATMIAQGAPPERRAEAIGLISIFSVGSMALAPYLGETVANAFGYEVFLSASASCSIVGLALTFVYRDDASTAGSAPHALHAAATATAADETGELTASEAPDAATNAAHARGELTGASATALRLPLLWLTLINGLSHGAMMTYLVVYMTRAGVHRVGAIFVSIALGTLLIRITLGRLGDQVNRDHLMIGSSFLILGGTAAVGFVTAQPWPGGDATPTQAAIGGLFGVAMGLWYPVANARYLSLGSPARMGRYMAHFQTAHVAGATGAGLVLGFVAKRWGFGPMYAIVALVAVASIGLYAAQLRRATLADTQHRPRA